MRYHAPARDAIARGVFDRLPLAAWSSYRPLLEAPEWPSIDTLNAWRPDTPSWRFVAQTPALLGDGLHYEQRIASRGEIATRPCNWHDLFNALVWLRHAGLKQALNRQQVAEIGRMGPRQRSRPQYALTHFDEAGVVVTLRSSRLLALWDAHDWHGLFWRHRDAWRDGEASVLVFGHALLEHALTPDKLLVGKAIVCRADGADSDACARLARAIAAGSCLRDPLELRPLPLSGLPGWHPDSDSEAFHLGAPCYQPRRADRSYPPPLD